MIFWTDQEVERLALTLDPERREFLAKAIERSRGVIAEEPTRGELVAADRAVALRAFPVQGMDLQLLYRHVEPGIVQLRVDMPRDPISVSNSEEREQRVNDLVDGPMGRLRAYAQTIDDRVHVMQRELRLGTATERDQLDLALDREVSNNAIVGRASRERDLDTPDRTLGQLTRHLADPSEARLHVHIARIVDGLDIDKVNELYVGQTLRRIADRGAMTRERQVDRDIPR